MIGLSLTLQGDLEDGLIDLQLPKAEDSKEVILIRWSEGEASNLQLN